MRILLFLLLAVAVSSHAYPYLEQHPTKRYLYRVVNPDPIDYYCEASVGGYYWAGVVPARRTSLWFSNVYGLACEAI